MILTWSVEANESSLTSDISSYSLFFVDSLKFNLQESASVVNIVEQALSLNVFPGSAKLDDVPQVDTLI